MKHCEFSIKLCVQFCYIFCWWFFIFAYKCGLFPGVDVWGGDNGWLISVCLTTEVFNDKVIEQPQNSSSLAPYVAH